MCKGAKRSTTNTLYARRRCMLRCEFGVEAVPRRGLAGWGSNPSGVIGGRGLNPSGFTSRRKHCWYRSLGGRQRWWISSAASARLMKEPKHTTEVITSRLRSVLR